MKMKPEGMAIRPYWFVGAYFRDTEELDRAPRFIDSGIWENGYKDKYLELVRTILPGDRIAIKSTYTRINNLTFDNRGHVVSAMAIKAIGTVTENVCDGRTLNVNWTPVPFREWYFSTYRDTVVRIMPGTWKKDALIAFTFDDIQQDIELFRNSPQWRERFGDIVTE